MAFVKRRVIRLQPMVVIGARLGGLLFYAQGTEYLKVSDVSVALLTFATLLNLFLVPAWGGVEVRGFGEIFPLNGPTWSLFFEYIANLLYVLAIRKLSTRWLAMLVFATGGALFGYAITNECRMDLRQLRLLGRIAPRYVCLPCGIAAFARVS